MILSQRERYIAIATGVVVVLVLLQTLAIGPYFSRRAEIAIELDAANADINKLDALFQQQRKMRKIWSELIAGGLSNTPDQAGSQLQRALVEWAQDSGVNVAESKPERENPEGKFLQISFHLTGIGPQRRGRLPREVAVHPVCIRVIKGVNGSCRRSLRQSGFHIVCSGSLPYGCNDSFVIVLAG